MQDIQYFLSEEEKYLASSQAEPELVWNEELEEFGFSYDPLSFLGKKPFQTFQHNNIDKENRYGLTDVEKMILTCFLGNISYAFRDDNYCGEVPDIVHEMQIILNSIINKAPKFNGNTLYRFTKIGDKTNFVIGDIYQPQHSLTTTTEDWEQDRSDVYVIRTLPEDETHAHSLYMIHNHGDETQVNFLRGTSFEITDIEPIEGTEYKRIYMSEIRQ
nr:hypothetical protein [Bacteroides acidifaciens]